MGTLGGIIGALVGMGIPEYEARRFEGRIRDGGILLSVHCDNDDWVKRGKEILRQAGAQDIGAAGEKAGDFANADKPMPRVRSVGSVVSSAPATSVAPVVPVPPEEVYVAPRTVIRRRTDSDIDLDDTE